MALIQLLIPGNCCICSQQTCFCCSKCQSSDSFFCQSHEKFIYRHLCLTLNNSELISGTPNNTPTGLTLAERQVMQQQTHFQSAELLGYYCDLDNTATARICRCKPLRPCSTYYIIVENHSSFPVYAKCSSDRNSMAKDSQIIQTVEIAPLGQPDWRVQFNLNTSHTYLTIGEKDAQEQIVYSVIDVHIQSGYCYVFGCSLEEF